MAIETTVAIVGAGASGLTLAALLNRAGIDFVILETRSRSYVEERQRAGVLDHFAAQVYLEAGLEEAILSGVPFETLLEIRHDGVPHFLNIPQLAGGRPRYVVPQQLLVRRPARRRRRARLLLFDLPATRLEFPGVLVLDERDDA